jgi:hypothetical protein
MRPQLYIYVLAMFLFAFSSVEATSIERFSLSAGFFNFDLSGTGTATTFVPRAEIPLTRNLLLEGSFGVARPEQSFDRTLMLMPEAQLQYQWRLGRFAPYIGGGGGAAVDLREKAFGGTDADLMLSASGGLRIAITDQLGTRADFRLRGLKPEFSGSVAELTFGLSWLIK